MLDSIASCICANTVFLNSSGMITLLPHNKQPPSIDNSLARLANGCKDWSTSLVVHPYRVYCYALLVTTFNWVAFAISLAVMGNGSQ